jgi:hypothetical protein
VTTVCREYRRASCTTAEVVPFVVEFEVAVPRLSPANW